MLAVLAGVSWIILWRRLAGMALWVRCEDRGEGMRYEIRIWRW